MNKTMNTIIYAVIGTVLAAMIAGTIINLVGNLNTDISEKVSFFFILLSPVIILGGTILGVIYARKYKK